MKNILLYLWQLPQNLLGLLVILFTGAEKKGDIYHTDGRRFGVSLGNYIIFGGFFNSTDKKHEMGHQKQSLYLGWLYLPVIGLPSAVGNLLNRVIDFDYYKQPWEASADRLGGVERC
jgi:hypothetical protein